MKMVEIIHLSHAKAYIFILFSLNVIGLLFLCCQGKHQSVQNLSFGYDTVGHGMIMFPLWQQEKDKFQERYIKPSDS